MSNAPNHESGALPQPPEFSTARKIFVVLGLILGLLLIPFMFWISIQYRPRESTSLADLNWLPTGEKLIVQAHVLDEKQRPLADVRVEFDTPAGTASGTTNAEGIAEFKLPEEIFHAIRINGHTALNRPSASWLRFPSAQAGVKLRVIVKDVEALRQSEPRP